MAFTPTTRVSTAFAGSPAETATSASFTPAANSRLLFIVFIVASGGDGSLFDNIVHTSNTGGLTITPVANGQSGFSGGGNACRIRLFEAVVGGSPSAMTATFDVDDGGTETAYTWVGVFDVTGSVATPSVKSGQVVTAVELDAGGSTETHTTGTLPAPVTNGNLALLILGRNNDSPGAATAPAGWSTLFNPTGEYVSGVVFYRTDYTDDGPVTITDTGEAVQSTASVLLELEEAGGDDDHTQNPTDNAGLTDHVHPLLRGTSYVSYEADVSVGT